MIVEQQVNAIASTEPNLARRIAPPSRGWGWYFYGVARHRADGEPDCKVGPGLYDGADVQMLPLGELVALISPVPLDELGADAIRGRARDATWLEAAVRGHERVVETIHRRRTILPAKFGCVYATTAELVTALEHARSGLIAQLERVAECDEWGVRLYADHSTIQRRLAMEDPTVRLLQQELRAARPGRAFFLKRRLADVLTNVTGQVLSELAQTVYDQLGRYAVAGQSSLRAEARNVSANETEILHAAFLVGRAQVTGFVGEIHRLVDGGAGLSGEYSGPWPPYSFVGLGERNGQNSRAAVTPR